MKDFIQRLWANPWCLAGVMTALFVGAIAWAFAEVLPADVVFLAPDAPLIPLTFRNACAQLFTPAPAVLNVVRLFPFGFAYEGSFWVDMAICCWSIWLWLSCSRCLQRALPMVVEVAGELLLRVCSWAVSWDLSSRTSAMAIRWHRLFRIIFLRRTLPCWVWQG